MTGALAFSCSKNTTTERPLSIDTSTFLETPCQNGRTDTDFAADLDAVAVHAVDLSDFDGGCGTVDSLDDAVIGHAVVGEGNLVAIRDLCQSVGCFLLAGEGITLAIQNRVDDVAVGDAGSGNELENVSKGCH